MTWSDPSLVPLITIIAITTLSQIIDTLAILLFFKYQIWFDDYIQHIHSEMSDTNSSSDQMFQVNNNPNQSLIKNT